MGIAAGCGTNLTTRQIGSLFGISHAAPHRVIDKVGPLLALAPERKRRIDSVALNAVHRTVRARVEHTLARMKCWKILRDYRRAASTLADAVSGIAHLHNVTLAS